jgi:6-pyruvoyl-tetrahydropterin synthase
MSISERPLASQPSRPHAHLQMTISASVQARWGHRVDGLIHTHAWTISAVVEGDPEAEKIHPADELEQALLSVVAPWQGKYLTNVDDGHWKGYTPMIWAREPTVEEITRQIWDHLVSTVPGLLEVSLEEAAEFDRCRVVTLRRR